MQPVTRFFLALLLTSLAACSDPPPLLPAVAAENKEIPDADPREKPRPETGLYHIGFKIGNSDEELKTAIVELEAAGAKIIGTADHTVTHSLYVLDPDGNELELYVDVSDVWKTDSSAVASPTKRLSL